MNRMEWVRTYMRLKQEAAIAVKVSQTARTNARFGTPTAPDGVQKLDAAAREAEDALRRSAS